MTHLLPICLLLPGLIAVGACAVTFTATLPEWRKIAARLFELEGSDRG